MKTVNKLKKKHRNDYWLDVDGFLWFWNAESADWWYLACGWLGGHFPQSTIDTDGWPDGPYTRVR